VSLCLLDAGLTLFGQPDDYWSGDRLSAAEANPLGLWLLLWHPLAFVAGVAASILLYLVLLSTTPANLARGFAFVVVFLHALGASTWLVRWGVPGYLLAATLFVTSAQALEDGWQRQAQT
jgi:hypothetical protein